MSAFTFDEIVTQLREKNVPLDKAQAIARRECGISAPAEPARDERIREKEEQAAVMKLLRENGFKVWSTSQARPSKISIGFPDLFCAHKDRPIAFFFETKRQVGGVVSEAQQEFGAYCRRCGVGWHTGDRHTVRELLISQGVLKP